MMHIDKPTNMMHAVGQLWSRRTACIISSTCCPTASSLESALAILGGASSAMSACVSRH
eukprot:CAMPEP_0176099286 /NCGR_PEP_ID=MMETSP0120_2-20121206/49790_1 /TAXON_ID=160619 /ORGANISM="Kryptoperidinium foliaceum, Strain CCMP 1326" /LENGTH=58 /DNA_ID=CAMNT_0017433313 /DNA_START=27 /DNA_END=200 /DNA_ORIENTATION=-